MERAAQKYKNGVVAEFNEQTKEGKEVLLDIAKSRAFIYPLQGIYYSLRHPSLLGSIKSQLYKSALTSLAITVSFFAMFYLPQVAFLALTSGPLALISAIPLVLGEAAVVSKFIVKALWMADAQEKLFDAVLASQPAGAPLVENAKNLSRSSAGRKSQVGRLLMKPVARFSPAELVRYALSLPLSALPIPGLGTAVFLVYNGTKSGPSHHSRYFALKGQAGAQRDGIVAQRRGAYASFGVMATALQLVPVASIFFLCTTTVGAALWAAELERLGEAANDPQHGDVLPTGGESGGSGDVAGAEGGQELPLRARTNALADEGESESRDEL
ncbi:hypothetical protein FIBSPDRAFT_863980 [Athelia psychrophila]|uniref:Outer spore wall protein RRT8 n=1 Tax=Athelia psychrophila TaxID=1759441 RepID=A0A166GYN9_9AGAM|nr:hypothetical protein FIBSPDRAFT_863980 [Fibularhizoctonia sp. CBS 109695]